MRRTLVVTILSSLAAAIAIACGGGEAEGPPIDTTPIVGVMEVPISFRNDGTAPTDALRIEANQRELRLESVPIYQLERGRIPAAEFTPDGPTKLTAAIHAAPARSRAAITFHAMVGYGTLARTIQALTQSGYREISIAVRPLTTGSPPAAVSWLPISSPLIGAAGEPHLDPATYGGGTRAWTDFQPAWEETYGACRAAGDRVYIDCDPVPLAFAEGGFLQVMLFARGQALQLHFLRVGGEPIPDPMEAAQRGPAMIEGVRRDVPGAGEEVPPTPDDDGVFSFRAEAATTAESPISAATRPVCGAQACQTVIEGDEETPVMRIVSFLGAAFPNGSTPPQLIFRLPG